jgi:MFS family permease
VAEIENPSQTIAPPSFWRRYFNLPRNVLALSLVSLLNDSSSEAIYPLLPFFLALTLGASTFSIGLIEGAAESAASLLKLAAGYLSDRFAKRKFAVFVGYGISGAMRPFFGFAISWMQVLLLRLVDRGGKGIRSAPRDALLADSVEPARRGRAFGFHRAMDNAGAVLGPLLAFFLLNIFASDRQNPTADNYSQVFFFASLPALLALVVIVFFVDEKSSVSKFQIPDSKFQIPNSKFQILESEGLRTKDKDRTKFNSNFIRFLLILILFTLSNSSDAFLLLRAQQAGISTVNIPLLWTVLNLVKVASSLIAGDLSDRVGRKGLIFSGWILYAAVYTGFAFVSTSSQAWALFLIYGVYFGLTEGAEKALVADLAPPERRGTAFGWYHAAFGIAVFPASLLTGALWKYYGATTAFLFCAIVSSLAAILLLTVKTKVHSEANLKEESLMSE